MPPPDKTLQDPYRVFAEPIADCLPLRVMKLHELQFQAALEGAANTWQLFSAPPELLPFYKHAPCICIHV